MFNLIRDLIQYTGGNVNNWIDSYIVQTCQVVIPVMVCFFTWCFVHLVTFICSWSKK